MKNYNIYLDKPASEWELASPCGNGSCGVMVYGGVMRERYQLSEESIWSGEKFDAIYPPFREKLNIIREMLLNGRAEEADAYAEKELAGGFNRIKSQETAGELVIELHPDESCEDYRRDLDLNRGISRVAYKRGQSGYVREVFASYPDKVIAARHTGAHDAVVTYERENILSRTLSDDTMTIKARPAVGGHEFTVKIKIKTDGTLKADGDKFIIGGASKTEYYIVIGVGREPDFPAECDYEKLKTRHCADFTSLMERSDISLEAGDDKNDSVSCDERIERMKNGECFLDAHLCETYFQFGKYLLCSSSRPGTLPANLQGVWNTYTEAPWNNDYHTNINLQMNYWHVESANISECLLPLADYVNTNLLESGRETARGDYGCRGAVLHHLSDIYGYTAPADGLWGLWPLGGAWLCFNLWEHYLYTLDAEYLKNDAYTYIHECARFFLDYMFEDENGTLLSGPSTSPENRYFSGDYKAYLCLSPTMDVEIIGGLLRIFIEADKIIGNDGEMAEEARVALSKMPPLKIGKHGQLMEWLEDYDEPEPGHRHISHMFALYPDCAINSGTPELYTAAEKTLRRRLANGGGHTGWSCAWLIALFARLGKAEDVKNTLHKLLTSSTRGNLFDSHPPFQIDGNFGAAAAIAEMLMQSQNGVIKLLPALPDCFANGSFERLLARGGIEVSAKWSDGRVKSATLRACRADASFRFICDSFDGQITLKKGESYTYTA